VEVYLGNSLVLLIGANPLPNYVVADYLLSEQNPEFHEIWLVHSERRHKQAGTKEVADRLREVLHEKYNGVSLNYCSLCDVGNANQIIRDIEDKLLKSISLGICHFNYTGGTKAMSVHIYRAIEKSDRFKAKIFSYLDARHFVLKDDEKGTITEDLRTRISVSLNDLISLHGYKNTKQKSYLWIDSLKVINQMIYSSEISKFLSWEKEVIRKLYYDKGQFVESSNRIRERLENNKQLFDKHEFTNRILPFLREFPSEHSILDKTGTTLWIPGSDISNNEYTSRIKPAVHDFLDGKWLENYIFMILSERIDKEFPDWKIPIGCNWKFRKEPTGKGFELDVILVNGYQVCGISCTTDSTESICKEKGFEIMHRVNQIGGEEGLAVLVTCLSHNDPQEGDRVDRLEEDLHYETGGEVKLRVLGIEDLQEEILWGKIRDHIWR